MQGAQFSFLHLRKDIIEFKSIQIKDKDSNCWTASLRRRLNKEGRLTLRRDDRLGNMMEVYKAVNRRRSITLYFSWNKNYRLSNNIDRQHILNKQKKGYNIVLFPYGAQLRSGTHCHMIWWNWKCKWLQKGIRQAGGGKVHWDLLQVET